MTTTIRQRRYIRTSAKDEYGNKARILDRRKQALALRAQGHSYRSIAAQMGVDLKVAWTDCTQALEQFADENSAEAVKQELLQVLRLATGHLVRDIESQAAAGGMVETVTNAAGDSVVKHKNWLNASTIAELNRVCGRIAQLMGIGDQNLDGEGSTATTNTSIVLVSPGSAAEFASRAAELAAARAEPAPIDVSVAQEPPEPPSTSQEASTPPEPAQAAPEPLLDRSAPSPRGEPAWRRNLAARRAAREAAQEANDPPELPEAPSRGRQRPAVRFLAPPQRN